MLSLPGQESLFEPGTREGQTKMVRHGEIVSCYRYKFKKSFLLTKYCKKIFSGNSWSTSNAQWTKVGDVVGAAGQSDSTKNFYEGKEYDFVFSVDIDEGKPPLKLPYNTSDDPWLAAQKFIHNHDLSQYYLDEVANFIIKNSKSKTSNGSQSNTNETYTDPFTGGSRYVPSLGNVSSAPTMSHAGDPFTGSGRYLPPNEAKKAQNSFFPVKDFLRFDQANIEAISGIFLTRKFCLFQY